MQGTKTCMIPVLENKCCSKISVNFELIVLMKSVMESEIF